MEQENTKLEPSSPEEKEIAAPPPRKKGRKLKILLAAAVVLIVLAAVTFYYLRFIAPYESTDDAFIDGYVTLVSSRVPGQVSQLLVTDNQEVKAGDVLVEIDPRDYEASLSQARADLAAAHSQSDQAQAQVKVSEAKVAQAQAAVTAAEAEAQRATDDLKRYESVESRAVSKSAFDLAQAQARSANANLEAARSQAKAAEAEVALSEAGVETAAAAVQQAEAKLQQAELNLSYTKIIAPRDARVTARTVQPGQLCAARPGVAGAGADGCLGDRQFQGNAVDLHAPGTTGGIERGCLSESEVQRQGGQPASRDRRAVQPVAAGKCGGQLRQGGPARAGQNCFRRSRCRPTWTSRRACPSCRKSKSNERRRCHDHDANGARAPIRG